MINGTSVLTCYLMVTHPKTNLGKRSLTLDIGLCIIFLPLSHVIWDRYNTSSSSTFLYLPSWHHPLFWLTHNSLHSPSIFPWPSSSSPSIHIHTHQFLSHAYHPYSSHVHTMDIDLCVCYYYLPASKIIV